MKQSQENTLLKAGDLVKCLISDHQLGFVKGQLYEVTASDKGLGIKSSQGVRVLLVDDKGNLLEASHNVTKHQCPIVLPRGV